MFVSPYRARVLQKGFSEGGAATQNMLCCCSCSSEALVNV